jgi:methylglutaconyl-CoA hydratase
MARDARGVVTVTIDDAPTRNALGTAALGRLERVLADIAADRAVRVLVLTGAGTVFSAGADRAESGDPALVARAAGLLAEILARIESFPVPVVCRLNGPAFGSGLAIAAAADIAISVNGAAFGLPEVRFGLVAGPAAVTCVARIGRAAGLDLLLTGRRFSAPEAHRLGLVTAVVDSDGLDDAVESVIADLLAGDRAALAATRRLVRQLTPPPLPTALAAAIAAAEEAAAIRGSAAVPAGQRGSDS